MESPKRLILAPVTLIAVACISGIGGMAAEADGEMSDPDVRKAKEAAVEILVLAKRDAIAAAKQSGIVFEAAHVLEHHRRTYEALDYFQEGLKLSPWNLTEQLAYARLLLSVNEKEQAEDIARMVSRRAENDALANAALALLKESPVAPPPQWDGSASSPWLCFVKIGPVNDVMLRESMAKISRTLGIPAWLLDEKIGMPKADRSSFERWVTKQIIPSIKWFTPPAVALLRSLDATAPEDVPPKKLVRALIQSLEDDGLDREAANLAEAAAIYQRTDKQWNAAQLADLMTGALKGRTGLGQAIIVGITAADLYEGDSNFLFGIAATGQHACLVSSARFQADFMGEPPDRSRLVVRLHKQLLSSIGFALNVPRPTDPTSARAYPASMAEHDAKSEYMSAACIAGFERALGHKLPPEARPPEPR